MSIWGSQSIQFVWFVTATDNVRASHLYTALIGEEPDSIQNNKTPNPANPFLSVATGVVSAVEYQVQVQPGRVDLHAMASNGDFDGAMNLVDTAAEITKILKAVTSIQDDLAPAVRLSIVANLILPTSSESESKVLFSKYSQYMPELEDFSDTIIQINRRKSLESGGVMNRILRYSQATMQHFMLEIIPSIGAGGRAVPVTKQRFGVSLSLDLNTVPDGRIIEKAQQVTILKELSAELIRLAEITTPAGLAD